MWPVFQEGDLLEVQPVGMAELRAGDCITYRLNNCGTFVTHRLIAIRDGVMHTRGDARPWPDDLTVSASQLIGRVSGRLRMGCSKPVGGGIAGRLAGSLYRYAGRFDPQRNARGGRASRRLRGSMQWLLGGFYRRGKVHHFGDADKNGSCYWMVGKSPWARYENRKGCWIVPWPQSLLIDPARLPDRGRHGDIPPQRGQITFQSPR